jgi:putative addiction module component (TIGR02574 family)
MSDAHAKIFEDALKLPFEARAELLDVLVRSLDDEYEPGDSPETVEAAWAVEIERRLKAIDSGEAKLIPGDEVWRRILER